MSERKLLHYTIREKIGAGGMGEVYLAHDGKLDREVAIKFLPPSLQEAPEARVRLLREAQAASRLAHPNIVAIYAIEKAEGEDFIVMEHIRGQTLSDVIAANALSLVQTLELARQIADALSAAHDTGVVHRDIKSSNILVNERGQAKVLDFGLATFYGATQVTDVGTTMGTASYMSPEQTEGRPIDHRSDLFSFGVVLYEMIAGRRPFEGETRNAVAYAICNHTPDPLARFKTGVSPAVENIVAKALRKDPTERYQSAADLAADLKVAARESTTSAPQQPYPPSHTSSPGATYPGAPQHTPSAPGAAYPGAPQHTPSTPGAAYPGAPQHTPSAPSAPFPGAPQHTPSQPAPAYVAPPPPKSKSNAVTIVTIVVGGLIAIAAIVSPQLGKRGSDQPAQTAVVEDKAPKTTGSQSTDRIKIAVLPFANLGNSDDEYFADGITEEITARLGSVRELGVVSRSSVEKYKGSNKSARDVGRELETDYVLAGTVRWSREADTANRVKVTPELVRVSDGTNVWSDVFDEPMTAVFKMQSTIAKTVVSQLDIAINEPEQAAMESRLTDNIEAYDTYLKGMRLKDNWNSSQDMRVAVSQFEKATSLDPDFTMAYVRLSEVNADMIWFRHDDSQTRVEASRRAAERALTISPESPDAKWAMGWHYYHARRDYENALRYLIPVLDLRPNSADAHSAVAYVQRRQGRFEEALANLITASELEPNDATLWYSVGETYNFLREYAKARPYLTHGDELRPEFPYGRISKVLSFIMEGDLLNARREARALTAVFGPEEVGSLEARVELLLRDYDSFFAIIKESATMEGNSNFRPPELWQALAHHILGNDAESKKSFAEAVVVLSKKLEESDDFRYHGAIGVAYAGLGEREKAMSHADRALQLMPPSSDAMRGSDRRFELAYTMILLGDQEAAIDQLELILSMPSYYSKEFFRKDPMLDKLRNNPRFKALTGTS